MSRVRALIAVIAGLAASGGPHAGAAPMVSAAATGQVSGIVLTDQPGSKPARGAMVMIAGTDVGLLRATVSDASGHFLFTGLPAGRFLVGAEKSAYAAAMYGSSRRGRPGSIVELHGGEIVSSLQLRLVPTAAISGRVTDDHDQPLAGVRVRILGRRTIGPEQQFSGDMGEPTVVTTDDRGRYRVFDLPSGDYVVGVQPRGIAGSDTRILNAGDSLDVTPSPQTAAIAGASIGYGPAFFSAAGQSEAAVISLASADERTGVDVRLTLGRFGKIDGVLTGLPAVPAQHQITLRPRGLDVSGTLIYAQNARAAADGRFSFTNVPPGDYTILARTLPAPPVQPQDLSPAIPVEPSWAALDLHTTGEDVGNLTLQWRKAVAISGQAAFEGLPVPPSDIRVRVNVRSTPASNVPTPQEAAIVDADGHFSISGLLPGKYWITTIIPANPVTQVPDWFAKSAVVNGQDALDVPFEITSAGAPVTLALTFTDDAQQLEGTVKDTAGRAMDGCPIVVFAADARFWFPQSRRIVVRRSDEKGAWLFGLASALPPGDYYVAAVPDLAPNEQFDSGLLAELKGTAQRVTLAAGDSKTLALVRSRLP